MQEIHVVLTCYTNDQGYMIPIFKVTQKQVDIIYKLTFRLHYTFSLMRVN